MIQAEGHADVARAAMHGITGISGAARAGRRRRGAVARGGLGFGGSL